MGNEDKPSKVEQWLYRLKNSCSDEELEQITEGLIGINYDKREKAKQLAEVRYLTQDDVEKAEAGIRYVGEPIGLGSGYWEIDRMTGGFVAGELTVIGAGTSQGKSMLSANLFAKQTMAGHKAVYVTLETLVNEFDKRLLLIMGRKQMEWCVQNKTLIVQKEAKIPWQSIGYLVENAVKEEGAEIVYIDHLHYFAQGVDDDPATIGMITQKCCDAAKMNEVPIVLMSQLNRSAPRGERPKVYDFKGSSYIEQNADIVLGVWQKYEEIGYEHVFVGVEKNRNRPIWRPEVGQTLFAREGLKILANAYDAGLDAEYSVIRK